MDALKWILKASIIVAMAFFGLQSEPQKKDQPEKRNNKSSLIQLITK